MTVCVTVYLTILELCVMSTCVNTSLVKMEVLVLQDPVYVHQDGLASMYLLQSFDFPRLSL